MRAQKKGVIGIARQLKISIDRCRKDGIQSIRARRLSGWPPLKRKLAEARIMELLRHDPQAFGFLKDKWVVRDIAKPFSKEGIK